MQPGALRLDVPQQASRREGSCRRSCLDRSYAAIPVDPFVCGPGEQICRFAQLRDDGLLQEGFAAKKAQMLGLG